MLAAKVQTSMENSAPLRLAELQKKHQHKKANGAVPAYHGHETGSSTFVVAGWDLASRHYTHYGMVMTLVIS